MTADGMCLLDLSNFKYLEYLLMISRVDREREDIKETGFYCKRAVSATKEKVSSVDKYHVLRTKEYKLVEIILTYFFMEEETKKA